MVAVLWIYGVSVVYTIIRYIAFAPEEAANLPVFVLNKGVSMGAALCFVAAFWQQRRLMRGGRSFAEPADLFRAGVWGVVVHIPMSLVILQPAYFPEFFREGDGPKLRFMGEMVFLFGAVAAGGVVLLHRSAWLARSRWWLSLVTMGALFIHVLSMGICRGLNINSKHAYLPPMWLLSLIAVGLGIAWLLMSMPGRHVESRSHQTESQGAEV